MHPPRQLITPGARYSIAVLTVVVFALTITGYVLSLNAIQHASRNTVSIVQLCQTINAQRARQIVLWEHVLAIAAAPPPGERPDARAARLRSNATFILFVERTFAPADCHHAVAPVP